LVVELEEQQLLDKVILEAMALEYLELSHKQAAVAVELAELAVMLQAQLKVVLEG
jgi:dimeric dUTPase (all-alpha-NTP-PPase superfamily)